MCGEQHDAIASKLSEDSVEALALFGIETSGWLVDDHQARVARDGLRNAKALAHAAGVGLHLALGGLGEIDAFEQFCNQFLAPLRRIYALQPKQEIKHLRTVK